MIKANELRIGNWVLLENDGKWTPIQVTGVCLASDEKKIDGFTNPFIRHSAGSSILRFGDDDSEDDFLVRPIPIIPEILEKCEFRFDDVFVKWFIYLNKHECDIDRLTFRESEGFICFDGVNNRTILKHIKYLHQLQNIFYDFSGKELTFKNETND